MASGEQASGSVYVDTRALRWEPTKFPGITCKILWQDEGSGAYTALFRFDPGAKLPRHRHVDLEQSFVLEGSLVDEDGTCTAGNFVWRRPGSVHSAWSPEGCLVLAMFQKPNEFMQ